MSTISSVKTLTFALTILVSAVPLTRTKAPFGSRSGHACGRFPHLQPPRSTKFSEDYFLNIHEAFSTYPLE
ncbi:hypothetical protein BDV24DRAFT_122737 [Aspergillus arachidicola]|uniref:Uncharacterized protein n=1 Tax=Aspergillus arachidicola TaxID=656916 RepID=A0A5N6YR31_9EURO|nr:hypothetical protein BDV24DRAFT_122737 [Aspergillus arachidicola]